MATMRAYKLQEFVAHASDVNCVKFGRRTSRILITGGDDQKVNLWVVGKPSAILSLSGFTSPVESVSFDSSEVMIGAGAASGTIKIWDVKEAKVFRTFTGHRSNCASLDFHPFGEFFASGSSDTNMKIWDIRKKGCIHTYKGHTRRIDVLRFTPDGRWIVSGGADNSVKRRYSSVAGEQNASASDEDALADLMENHQEFIHVVKSRLAKLEVVYRCWQNNDIMGSVDVMQRMLDHAVTADITSVLMENTTKYITLDICTSILPLASSLLESRYDRHLNIALEMILKLVKSFGATISSTLLAAPPVGVDLEAEQRLERCKLCFQELKKVNSSLVSLTRLQGEVGRSAQELSLFLQDIFQLSSR